VNYIIEVWVVTVGDTEGGKIFQCSYSSFIDKSRLEIIYYSLVIAAFLMKIHSRIFTYLSLQFQWYFSVLQIKCQKRRRPCSSAYLLIIYWQLHRYIIWRVYYNVSRKKGSLQICWTKLLACELLFVERNFVTFQLRVTHQRLFWFVAFKCKPTSIDVLCSEPYFISATRQRHRPTCFSKGAAFSGHQPANYNWMIRSLGSYLGLSRLDFWPRRRIFWLKF
jgi:hypothetical protein